MDSYAKALVLVARLTGLGLFISVIRPADVLLGDVWQWQYQDQFTLGMVFGFLVRWLPTIVLLVLALHLMLGGRWLIRRLLRGLDGTCPACGHAPPERGCRCPECGFRVFVRDRHADQGRSPD